MEFMVPVAPDVPTAADAATDDTICRHVLPNAWGRGYLESTVDLWRPYIVEESIRFCRPWAEADFFVISNTIDEPTSTGTRAAGSDGEWFFFALEPELAIRTGMVTREARAQTGEGWANVRGPLAPDLVDRESKARRRHRQYVNAERKKDEARTDFSHFFADLGSGFGRVTGGIVGGIGGLFGSAGRSFVRSLGPTGSALLVGGVAAYVLWQTGPLRKVFKGLRRR